MSQITLIKKIKDDAMATVAEIKTTGAAQVEAVQRETEKAIASFRKEKEEKLQKKLENIELVALSKAKQAARMKVQGTKRNQVDKLFTEVIAEFAKLPAEQYVIFFKKHLKEVLPNDISVISVFAPANRVSETKEIISEIGFGIEVVPNAKSKAGLIVKAEDGVYDITLERMINDKRADLEIKIMQKLA